MTTKPQKIEGGWVKEYSKIMLEWIESQWKIEQAHQNGEPYTRMKFEADADKVEKKLKSFISTEIEKAKASERQRCVEAWDKAEKHGKLPQPNPFGRRVSIASHNRVIKEMGQIFNKALDRAKHDLEQLK